MLSEEAMAAMPDPRGYPGHCVIQAPPHPLVRFACRILTDVHTYTHIHTACIHTNINALMHTYMYTYIHIYIHIHMYKNTLSF